MKGQQNRCKYAKNANNQRVLQVSQGSNVEKGSFGRI